MKQFALRLPDKLYARLRERAKSEGVSINAFLGIAIADYLARCDEWEEEGK